MIQKGISCAWSGILAELSCGPGYTAAGPTKDFPHCLPVNFRKDGATHQKVSRAAGSSGNLYGNHVILADKKWGLNF